jgi:hypothetical protein
LVENRNVSKTEADEINVLIRECTGSSELYEYVRMSECSEGTKRFSAK